MKGGKCETLAGHTAGSLIPEAALEGLDKVRVGLNYRKLPSGCCKVDNREKGDSCPDSGR